MLERETTKHKNDDLLTIAWNDTHETRTTFVYDN